MIFFSSEALCLNSLNYSLNEPYSNSVQTKNKTHSMLQMRLEYISLKVIITSQLQIKL